MGSLVNGVERLEWPDEAVVASVARSERASLDRNQSARAEREAVAYLLASQRPNGSWIVPLDAFCLDANLYTTPVTALCARSLIPLVADAKVRDAVKKACDYVLTIHRSHALEARADLAGVYSIWGRTFVLWFLGSCTRAGIGDAKEIESTMKDLLASIEKSQHRGGGWPYVALPGDPSGAGFDPSASFLTAGVLLVLLDARDAGLPVSKDAIAKGLKFLDRSRQKDGTYRYMPDVPGGTGADAIAEAAGRGPACAWLLQRGGIGSVDGVRDALKTFDANRTAFKKEWHKALCHTGPEGLGAHYLLYDYWFAAAAVRALPEKERSAYRDGLRADVLDARFADGSFEDFPPLGRAYSTAMALLTLRELRAEK
ncbi:MAG: hypothetical protein HYR85_18420 [Planctomycetes bacterium]|nr:hypothetical protein [Planctomycetota bacterium]